MGTRALTGFRKDGKYYMAPRKLDGGYFVAGTEILKCYINNTKEDFEQAFNMIDFKEEPKDIKTLEDAIKEGLFYKRYDLDSTNLITLINSKNIEMASVKKSPFGDYVMTNLDEEMVVYEVNGMPKIIPYSKVKHLDIVEPQIEGKISFVNYDILKNDVYASYMYIYDFDNDSLECYSLKAFERYENKDNKKEIHLKDNKLTRFVNTFTFTRESRLRKYLELFEFWFFIEKIFREKNGYEDREYMEDIVNENIDEYLELLRRD